MSESPLKFPPIKVIGQKQLDHALSVVKLLPIDEKKPWIVRFSQTPLQRSEAQKNLYFLWCGEMTSEKHGHGESKEEYHERHKKNTFLQMYLRRPDTEETPNYYLTQFNCVKEAMDAGDDAKAQRRYDALLWSVSSNDATVEEFTEALKKIEKEAAFAGIMLSRPEYRGLAMGERGR